jgi:MoaA/NifB/PqqE/SkfB family radical SAM enzyme
MVKENLGLLIELIDQCQNECRHCYGVFGGSNSRSLKKEVVKGVIDQFNSMYKTGQVLLTGGEPTLHPDLPELLTYINQTNLDSNMIFTNGGRIASEERYIDMLVQSGLRNIGVGLFGLEDTHDWFTQRKGSFRDIIKTTDRSLENGVGVIWRIYPHQNNLDDLKELIDMGKEKGVSLSLIPFGLHGRAKKNYGLKLTPGKKGELIEKYPKIAGSLRYYSESELVTRIKGTCSVCLPIDFFFVDVDLDVYPCCHHEKNEEYKLGNLHHQKVEEVADSRPLIIDLIESVGFEGFASPSEENLSYSICEESCEACKKWIQDYKKQ